MSIRWNRAIFGLLLLAALAASLSSAMPLVADAAQPKDNSTPTPVPTPNLALELIPNGTWDVIIETHDIQYSKMTLKADGTAITGKWTLDRKTAYLVNGVRDGTHLKLDIKPLDPPDAQPVGKIDATLDGIADMFGTITLNGNEMPFQGAQHARVPPPVEAASGAPGAPGGPGGPSGPGMPGPGYPTPYH